jgi:hypothetical protein
MAHDGFDRQGVRNEVGAFYVIHKDRPCFFARWIVGHNVPVISKRNRLCDIASPRTARRWNLKSYRKELWFNIPGRRAFVNITPQVEICLRESGIMEGLLLCNAMHITASVFINDDESGLHNDYERWLERLAPHEPVSHEQRACVRHVERTRMS